MKKILLIDDEKILVNLLKKKLSEEGYKILIALDGQEGFLKMKRTKPDLVLLDMVMPKMPGIELMEKVAKDETLKKIPIIIISNSGQPIELERAKKLGARDWLIKTEFDPQEVVDKVIKQIGK